MISVCFEGCLGHMCCNGHAQLENVTCDEFQQWYDGLDEDNCKTLFTSEFLLDWVCINIPLLRFRRILKYSVLSANDLSLCSHIFLVLRDHGVNMYVFFIWKWSSAHALGGVSGVYLLQLLFSACVAAVKSRTVLHHCVVIFFWSSGIMECTCMLFTFKNGVLLMR